jgi:hypothetical protein
MARRARKVIKGLVLKRITSQELALWHPPLASTGGGTLGEPWLASKFSTNDFVIQTQ